MDAVELVGRAGQLCEQYALNRQLDPAEQAEALTLIEPMLRLLDCRNPAHSRVFDQAWGARHATSLFRAMEALTLMHRLLSDTEEDVQVAVALWAAEHQQMPTLGKYRAMALMRLSKDAVPLLARVVSRFPRALPGIVERYRRLPKSEFGLASGDLFSPDGLPAFRQGRQQMIMQRIELLLDAHELLSREMSGQS